MGSSVNDFVTVTWSPVVSLRSMACNLCGRISAPIIDWVESNVKPDKIVSSYLASRSIRRRQNPTELSFPNVASCTGPHGKHQRASVMSRFSPMSPSMTTMWWLGSYHFPQHRCWWCAQRGDCGWVLHDLQMRTEASLSRGRGTRKRPCNLLLKDEQQMRFQEVVLAGCGYPAPPNYLKDRPP